MTKSAYKFGLSTLLMLSASCFTASAQDTAAKFVPKGTLWGYAFGDFAYKAASDNTNRGGSNQYTKVAANSNMFQFRRIYLGYNYDISPKFSAEFLLAAEDDFSTASPYGSSGDVLANNKFSPYIKLANIRWKQIYPGADLVFGQVATPAFPMMSEAIWGYRSIERTITDIRRTPSFDMGVTLQGRFIPKDDRFGYNVMVGNGQSAKPETDNFKWFYGDVYAKLFKKRLVIDLYQDYEKLDWNMNTAIVASNGPRRHDRNMTKLFVAWTQPKWTVGLEAFTTTLLGDVQATKITTAPGAPPFVYINTQAFGASLFVRGRIKGDKLGFFARGDYYDPSKYINNNEFKSYTASTSQYDPTTKEMFLTYGLDYTPVKNVHIMPNVWFNNYMTALDKPAVGTKLNDNSDLAYRLTFYWIFRP